jgi:signal transduction histidine kinase
MNVFNDAAKRQSLVRMVVLRLALFCLIGVFMSLLDEHGGVWENVLISLCIGCSTWVGFLLFLKGRSLGLASPRQWAVILAGIVVGFKLAALAGADDVLHQIINEPQQRWPLLLVCMAVSLTVISLLTFSRRAADYRAALAVEQQRLVEARQAETAARLALLQAQIEPHFLFNTLANVQSLIDTDGQTAKLMLDHLNGYLRASLARTRKPDSTLADELDLIEHLLFIASIRLGARLRYRIDVDAPLRGAKLPPLLLQPLVENALRHGIEPALAGGEIVVSAASAGEVLELTVSDNGVGMSGTGGAGVGLANVRARLHSLFGDKGRLVLSPLTPSGVVARLQLPLRK